MQRLFSSMYFLLFFLSFSKTRNNQHTNSANNMLKNKQEEREVDKIIKEINNISLENNVKYVNTETASSTEIDIEEAINKIGQTKDINTVFNIIQKMFVKESDPLYDTSDMSYKDKKVLIDKFTEALFQHKDLTIDNYYFLPEINSEDWVVSSIPINNQKKIIGELKQVIDEYSRWYKILIKESEQFIEFFKELICNYKNDQETERETKERLFKEFTRYKLTEYDFSKRFNKLEEYRNVFKDFETEFNINKEFDISLQLLNNGNIWGLFEWQMVFLYEIFGEILTGHSNNELVRLEDFCSRYEKVFN